MAHYTTNKKNGTKIVPRQTNIPRNEKIRAMYAELNIHGQRIYSMRKLARIYHLSPSRIWEIINPEEARI